MAVIDKKLIHFKKWDDFISACNNDYTTPSSGDESAKNAVYGQIKGTSIVFIQDVQKIWTHGNLYTSVNWRIIDENTKAIRNEKLYEILNSVYEPVSELDTNTATSMAIVSLLNQTY